MLRINKNTIIKEKREIYVGVDMNGTLVTEGEIEIELEKTKHLKSSDIFNVKN